MKVSLLKVSRNKEVIKRLELNEIAEMIRENPEKEMVYNLRLKYQFYTLDDLLISRNFQ